MNDRLDELLKLHSVQKSLMATDSTHANSIKEGNFIDERSHLVSPDNSTTDSDSSPSQLLSQFTLYEDGIDSMQSFNKRINIIKYCLRHISYNFENALRLKHLIIHSVSPSKEKNYSSRLDNLLEDTQKTISQTQRTIFMIKEELKESSKHLGYNNLHSEFQMRQNIIFGLSKKFKDQVQEFRVLQAEYKHQIRDKAIRQIKIINPKIKDCDIQAILAAGKESIIHHVFNNSLTGELDFEDLVAKSRDIKKLEANVEELHQLFIEIAECVDLQDDAIDHIEIAVNKNKDLSDRTNLELGDLSIRREQQRKRMLILTCTLILLSIFILARTFTHILPNLKI